MANDLSPTRLEAFSDGVIAIIITIMVLELKIPGREISNSVGIWHELPLIFVYLLSFIQVGIYWVNHHYLIDDLEQVTHGILWSNLGLLFSLSLIPWATTWVGERGITSFSIALYAVICQLPAFTWLILAPQVHRRSNQPLAGGFTQQVISAVLYTAAVPLAYVSPYISLGMICVVAVIWMLPPKKIQQKTKPPAEF